MLGGMAALPGPEWELDRLPTASLVRVSHGFTHFTLDLAILHRSEAPEGEGWWHPLERIGEAGLPTLYRRAVDEMTARKDELAA